MQKRQSGGVAGGGSATPVAKRGRPLGSVNSNSAAASATAAAASSAADSVAPPTLLGPSLHVHYAFAGQLVPYRTFHAKLTEENKSKAHFVAQLSNYFTCIAKRYDVDVNGMEWTMEINVQSPSNQNNKRIVLALQSGLKSELTWALNALTLLSFKEKDEVRKDATPLAKIPGLLDALLQVIDDWRDIALPRVLVKTPRVRLLGANSAVTGFGNEYEALNSDNSLPHPSTGSGSSNKEASVLKCANKLRPGAWNFDEDGLFNLDEEGRAEKQLCAVAASNIIRNFSNMPDNEVIMAQHRHCFETIFQCLEDYVTGGEREDEELVTNALETVVNLALLLNLRIFSSSKPSFIKMTEKRAVKALMGMLGSAVKAWHSGAAELIGRLIINPDNEPFLLPFASQIYTRLVDIMSSPPTDAQAAAVGALYNLAEINMDCRLKLASERW
uniref:SWI/SNF-like complex subunit BAF250 C-terminal domain-containing protein n=1 Tax=Solanum lycopersicum TaxID=4081 RepID=A0A3Q7FCQ0_SOLLC